MSDKELADYLNEDLETRYQIHKAAYFERYPDSNIEKFHRFETAYLKRQIQKYNTKEKIEPEETEIYLSQIEVLEYINSISSSKTPQQAETKPKKLEAPISFDELFYDANFISPCIDILKVVDPPLLDAECNYIGKLKGAFCVWIDEMQRQGIVKHFSNREIYASLLPQRIKRFSIDESMFGKPQPKAEENYRTDMKTLLSQIKLSQYSQSGKLGK